jgi:hypothetical protein
MAERFGELSAAIDHAQKIMHAQGISALRIEREGLVILGEDAVKSAVNARIAVGTRPASGAKQA